MTLAMKPIRLALLVVATLFYMGCEHVSANEDGGGCVTPYNASDYPASTVSFENDVKPILANNSCSSEFCHGASSSPPSNFSVNSAESIMGPGNEAAQLDTCDILRGDPDGSFLVMKLEGTASIGEQMPFGGTPLTSGELNTIRDWIAQGAPDN